MRTLVSSGKRVIRFRRLTRKAYSVFASLGVCVTIGSLRVQAADRSMVKQSRKTMPGWKETAQTASDSGRRKKETAAGTTPLLWSVIPGQPFAPLIACTYGENPSVKKEKY